MTGLEVSREHLWLDSVVGQYGQFLVDKDIRINRVVSYQNYYLLSLPDNGINTGYRR